MFFSSVLAATAAFSVVNALSSTLQQVTDFNGTPTDAKMFAYVPTSKLAKPPIVVAIHHCQGSAAGYFSETQGYPQAADKSGFILLYPQSPATGGCWDVSSNATLMHNGGGDSQTIVNMVKYALTKYGGDANRVYVTGSSSGAMMTNILAGAYPDVFKAATLYGGVPDGCFYVANAAPNQPPQWNGDCAHGRIVKTAKQWGDQVRSYYPGYDGPRTSMLLFHGTIDNTLVYQNFNEELKQWSDVLGVSFTSNQSDSPIAGYTKMIYGDGSKLVGISAANVGHTPRVRPADDLAWFGL
ncbi:related to acetylxylan esterase (subclass of the carboxylic acid esterases) [Rhynchosporium secalis]|uniref:Carboxylic ester hydrolase n=1 Tax=Rhynchosporium secalis TaxID=38038 RepID=A0A1E1LY39_RHYSE|nr:related to acetylxylan esterase (subclass of the carboxylic acid esterases) [Rhynchosporium secalis]